MTTTSTPLPPASPPGWYVVPSTGRTSWWDGTRWCGTAPANSTVLRRPLAAVPVEAYSAPERPAPPQGLPRPGALPSLAATPVHGAAPAPMGPRRPAPPQVAVRAQTMAQRTVAQLLVAAASVAVVVAVFAGYSLLERRSLAVFRDIGVALHVPGVGSATASGAPPDTSANSAPGPSGSAAPDPSRAPGAAGGSSPSGTGPRTGAASPAPSSGSSLAEFSVDDLSAELDEIELMPDE